MENKLKLQIGLAYFAFILIGAYEGSVGVLLPSLQLFYKVDKATIGLIFLFSTSGYLVAAFVSGILVAKIGVRNLLLLGAGSFIVGASSLAFMLPFYIMLPALFFAGFGIATWDAGLNSYIAALPNNTALLNYLHAFYGVGALIGPLTASTVLITIGWNWNVVYFLWISIALVVMLGFRFIFQAQPRPTHPETHSNQSVMLETLKLPIVWIAAIFLMTYVGAEVSLGNWSYTYLTEERRIEELFSGWMVSGYWLGLTLGRFTLGRVAQRIGNKALIQWCLLGTITGILLLWLVPFGFFAAFGLILTGFSLGPIFPTVIAMMPGLVSGRVLASAIGFLASLGAAGAALFPWVAGILARVYGIWLLLPYVIVITIVMLALWLFFQKQPAQVSNAGYQAADKHYQMSDKL